LFKTQWTTTGFSFGGADYTANPDCGAEADENNDNGQLNTKLFLHGSTSFSMDNKYL
jgi:hypothetical protein